MNVKKHPFSSEWDLNVCNKSMKLLIIMVHLYQKYQNSSTILSIQPKVTVAMWCQNKYQIVLVAKCHTVPLNATEDCEYAFMMHREICKFLFELRLKKEKNRHLEEEY